MNKDLTTHTPGERLWLWRKQENVTGHEAAANLGVGRNAFWDAEKGRRALPAQVPRIRALTLPLLLQLARKRAGWGLAGTARRLKVTHPTLLDWEREGLPELQAWWERRGFIFD